MSWSPTQRDMEHFFGLTEVAMIRLSLKEWASPGDLEDLTQIATSNPCPITGLSFNRRWHAEVLDSPTGFGDLRSATGRRMTNTSRIDSRRSTFLSHGARDFAGAHEIWTTWMCSFTQPAVLARSTGRPSDSDEPVLKSQ